MSYEKQTWANGDIITAQKLNHMEGGIETASPLIVTFNSYYDDDLGKDIVTCDRTFSECLSAWENGTVLIGILNERHAVHQMEATGSIYYVEDDGFYLDVYRNWVSDDVTDQTKIADLSAVSAMVYYYDDHGIEITVNIGTVLFGDSITTRFNSYEYYSDTGGES